MRHLDEGTLVALRDGDDNATSAEARAHMDACAECRDALDSARRTAEIVANALTALQEPVDVGSAREAVRSRISAAAGEAAESPSIALGARRARWGASALARAAGLILVAAVGASALPGSPVRQWVTSVISSGEAPSPVPVEAPEPGRVEDAGIRVAIAAAGRVRVVGLQPGDAVVVEWVPGSEVAVFAGSGSRFRSDANGVLATVTGGPVRIELPVDVRPLALEVEGRTWLTSRASGVEFLVAPEDPAAAPLRFAVPEGEVP
jgi:hypothetical protein